MTVVTRAVSNRTAVVQARSLPKTNTYNLQASKRHTVAQVVQPIGKVDGAVGPAVCSTLPDLHLYVYLPRLFLNTSTSRCSAQGIFSQPNGVRELVIIAAPSR